MCDEGKRDSLMFFPLVDALNDNDAGVRSAAAKALSKLEDERAIAALKQRLEIDDSIQVIPSLRKALEKLQHMEK
jgi:HEAT repeat protein